MAKHTVVTLVDDLDNSEASQTVEFGIDGKRYEIDLSEDNATALRKALAPFVEAARKAGGRQLALVSDRKPAARRPRSEDTAAKREWLRAQGFDVGNRGRFSVEMEAAWNAREASPATDTPAEAPEAVSEAVSAPDEAPEVEAPEVPATGVRTRVKKLTGPNIGSLIETGVAVATGSTFAIIEGDTAEALRKVQAAMDAEPNKKGGNYPSLIAVRNKLAKADEKFIVTEAV